MDILSDVKILQVLMGYNPWWTSGIVPKDFTKPVKRLPFYETLKIFEHPTIRREVILSGPRRVGKTTILYQVIESYLPKVSPKTILYVSFDHPLLKLCDMGRILDVFRFNISIGNRELYLFFDEVQYASDWNHWLKTLYDNHPEYHILATGSASPILSDRMTESGVGRWTEVKIPTLSFYEYIELMGIEKPNLSESMNPTLLASMSPSELATLFLELTPLQKHFHQYLLVGGFPEVALSGDIPYAQKIIREDVVDKVLKRDMISLFNIRNVSELEKIFLYLCLVSGNIIEQATIAKEIGVSRPTVSNYIEFLEQANLIYISQPAVITGKKLLKSKPKIYLADAAIRNAVLLSGEEILTNSEEMGMIIETTVYKHLHSFYYAMHPEVGYFRDAKTQKEIDIIVTFPRSRILLEVKYRENPKITEKEAIVDWANDSRTGAAIVVTKNAQDYGIVSHPTKTPIMKVPAFAFLYLLGHAEYNSYK